MAAVVLKWHGKKLSRQMDRWVKNRLTRAAIHLKNAIKVVTSEKS